MNGSRIALLILCLALVPGAAGAESWPSFRGPGARGVAEYAPEL